MSRRVFATVKRKGNMDETAVCVFPWELPILQLIHGQEVKEIPIEEMSTHGKKEGVVKVEKQKLKYKGEMPPDLRQQLEIMAYVDPEDDPALDPTTEYGRMVELYGMDTEIAVPCVERIYGPVDGGRWDKVLKEAAKDRLPKPVFLKAKEEGLDKAPNQMTVGELRDALDVRHVEWTPKLTKGQLADLLEKELVS